MKKLIYTLCLFTGMAISSCEDWLARDPLDQIADVNLTYTADECKPVSYTHLTLPTT